MNCPEVVTISDILCTVGKVYVKLGASDSVSVSLIGYMVSSNLIKSGTFVDSLRKCCFQCCVDGPVFSTQRLFARAHINTHSLTELAYVAVRQQLLLEESCCWVRGGILVFRGNQFSREEAAE